MPISEDIITGKKYRVWNVLANKWKRYSFWSKASDVELNDGTTVEDTIGALTLDLTASDDLVFNFTKSGTKYGYKDSNGNFVPFKTAHTQTKTIDTVGTTDMGEDHEYRYIETSGLMVTPTATKAITANGNNIDVLNYASVNVSVPRGNLNFQAILNDQNVSGTRTVSCNIGDIVVYAGGISLRSGATFVGSLYQNSQFNFARATSTSVVFSCSAFCSLGRIY